jgi:hypothetical protein
MGTAMNDFQSDSAANVTRSRFQLDAGWDVLSEWSKDASQSYRNAVHTALFSMLDRTLFRTHYAVADRAKPNEFFVAVKQDLVLKLRVSSQDTFDIVYLGAWEDAPGAELGRV